MLGCLGNQIDSLEGGSLSCVLQRLHVEIYELNEFDELVLVNV